MSPLPATTHLPAYEGPPVLDPARLRAHAVYAIGEAERTIDTAERAAWARLAETCRQLAVDVERPAG